jgi:hypothetical protein
VRRLHPGADDEAARPRTGTGQLAELCAAAGLTVVADTYLSVAVEHATFEEWWEPYTFGVGPAGVFGRGLDPEARAELREACRELLPPAPFVITAGAWAVRARP